VRRAVATVLLSLGLAAPAAAAAPPPGWHPDVRAARAWAAQRTGDVSFAVRTGRRGWSWRAATTYRSASVVKAMLLVGYLRRADVRGRALRAGERALLDPMIRYSDNDAADAIHARVGVAGLSALGRRAGMRHFVPHPAWGGSAIAAIDQARFFLRIDRFVPRRHRAYAMRLLRGVIAGQRWGIARAVPRGWRIAFKGGWGKGVTREVNHQAALLTNGRLRVSIAVMTADNPSHEYGAATQQGVAARLLRGLARTAKGKVVRVRRGLGGLGTAGRRRCIESSCAGHPHRLWSWPAHIASSSSTSTARSSRPAAPAPSRGGARSRSCTGSRPTSAGTRTPG
jgi:beta-lactamase family protein